MRYEVLVGDEGRAKTPTLSKFSKGSVTVALNRGPHLTPCNWPLILSSLKSLLETGTPLEAATRWPKNM